MRSILLEREEDLNAALQCLNAAGIPVENVGAGLQAFLAEEAVFRVSKSEEWHGMAVPLEQQSNIVEMVKMEFENQIDDLLKYDAFDNIVLNVIESATEQQSIKKRPRS